MNSNAILQLGAILTILSICATLALIIWRGGTVIGDINATMRLTKEETAAHRLTEARQMEQLFASRDEHGKLLERVATQLSDLERRVAKGGL